MKPDAQNTTNTLGAAKIATSSSERGVLIGPASGGSGKRIGVEGIFRV